MKVRSVRSKHGKDEVAIIVTSAITDEVNMAECYDLGVNDFIEKPILQNKLLDTIRRQTEKILG